MIASARSSLRRKTWLRIVELICTIVTISHWSHYLNLLSYVGCYHFPEIHWKWKKSKKCSLCQHSIYGILNNVKTGKSIYFMNMRWICKTYICRVFQFTYFGGNVNWCLKVYLYCQLASKLKYLMWTSSFSTITTVVLCSRCLMVFVN